jgi:hypothetical protein
VEGDHSPAAGPPICPMFSADSLLLGELFRSVPRTGELGRLPRGVPGNEEPVVGVRVKRKSFAESCQNVRRDVNISDHPSGVFSSGANPTLESSDVISPIRSSFGMRFRPRNTPSRFILIRHSPLGLPSSGVFFEDSVIRYGEGSG